MTMKTKMMIATAAMGGLFAGAASRASAAVVPTSQTQTVSANSTKTVTTAAHPGTRMLDDTDKGKHDCKGKNDCKGMGGCKTSDNGCKGKNSCKGKGGCSGKDDK
ncbi:MAG TPA: hypothetical protein VKK61_02890 [Tepidisphaeraceae bacterium]|jgi:hypothetical protein|nr:hypothetical protein [Tepidisphaeraceae bacterium]